MYKWCHESRRNYTFVKLKATKISKRCVLFWSRGPDGYRKNDRKRAVVWPWLVLELSTVLALTQLGIRQSDWRRAGIRSTNLHIVVEYRNWPRYGLRWSGGYCNPAQHELCRPSRGRAGRHNECCAGLQYPPRQRRPYKWSISILPRSQFYKKQGKLAFSTFCTAVRPHRRLRNDAWRRDS